MKYSFLGRTGVRVSHIGLGTATLGVAPTAEEASNVVAKALDLGINLFDTSNSYGNQARFDRPGLPPAAQRKSAEEILGAALKGRRNDVILCTKVMEPVGEGPNDRGLSRVHIMNQVEQSLRRLGTDHIDVYYQHHPDPNTPLDETLRAFDDLVKQGKVRYPALSTFGAWQLTEAMWVADKYNLAPPVCNQIRYNLAFRATEADVLPAMKKFGLTATVFSPLGGGLFAGEEVLQRPIQGGQRWGAPGFSEAQIAMARAIFALARESDMQPTALVLGWLLSNPVVSTAVVGPETLDELEAIAPMGDVELTPELLAKVEEIGRAS